jgi:hypothetical protein
MKARSGGMGQTNGLFLLDGLSTCMCSSSRWMICSSGDSGLLIHFFMLWR